jgi:phage gpG-like protein
MAADDTGLLSFESTGGAATAAGLAAIANQVRDLRPFWREVFAPLYFAGVQDLFNTGGRVRGIGGRFAGGAWARLSPGYALWKQKAYPGQGILQRTGRLQESLRWSGTTVGREGLFDASPTAVVVGTRVPYGAFHQSGTRRMPARPFLPTPDPAIVAPLMQAWIMKVAK